MILNVNCQFGGQPFASSTPKPSSTQSFTQATKMTKTQNGLIMSNDQSQSSNKGVRGRKIRQFTIKSTPVENKIMKYDSQLENNQNDRNKSEIYNSLQNGLNEEARKLCDTIMQKDLTNEQIDEMEESMKQLDGFVQNLKGHVRSISAKYRSSESSSNGEAVTERDATVEETIQHNAIDGNSVAIDYSPKRFGKTLVDSNEISEADNSTLSSVRASSSQWNRKRNQTKRTIKEKMVSIGYGNAKVSAKVMREIMGKSHTVVTRKLLTAVFPRRVLATHSLTGRPSPAFPNKPAKKKLNEAMVNDIIMTVMENCNTQECHVRTSITTKCADEAKMYRNRQQKDNAMKKENLPPSDIESEAENSDYSMYSDSYGSE